MAYIKNRIIHRFIRDITEYLENGVCYGQVLPADTQVYADYKKEAGQIDEDGKPKVGLYYVIGDGIHTYTEIRDGHGENNYNKEYAALESDSRVLKDVYIHNLKSNDLLVWNSEKDRWINFAGPLLPVEKQIEMNHIDCGNATTTDNDIIWEIDGGNAGTPSAYVLNSGKVSSCDYNIEFIKWLT